MFGMGFITIRDELTRAARRLWPALERIRFKLSRFEPRILLYRAAIAATDPASATPVAVRPMICFQEVKGASVT